ncbi:MAG: cytochrome P450 [Actinobacteria bacterium]|nr:cytochrome P450 [Actinomycetota bacterium]
MDPIEVQPGLTLLTRHADVLAVLRSKDASSERSSLDPAKVPAGFSERRAPSPAVLELFGGEEGRDASFLFRDPPDHTRLRGIVSKAFTPKMVRQLTPVVEGIAERLISAALEHDSTDFLTDVAYPLPVEVISRMMGIPEGDDAQFQEWSRHLARSLDPQFTLSEQDLNERDDAELGLATFLLELINDRRKNLGDDLLSALVVAEDEGSKLTSGEVLATSILLLVAGHETTVNLITGGVHTLTEFPDEQENIRLDRSLLRSGVEEMLRYVSPVGSDGRSMRADIEVGGKVIEAGTFALMLLSSANRDSSVFEAPNRFDPKRDPNPHLGFGFGLHHCLGSPLARLEAQVTIGCLLDHTKAIALAADEVRYRPNLVLRGLEALPLQLSPR